MYYMSVPTKVAHLQKKTVSRYQSNCNLLLAGFALFIGTQFYLSSLRICFLFIIFSHKSTHEPERHIILGFIFSLQNGFHFGKFQIAIMDLCQTKKYFIFSPFFFIISIFNQGCQTAYFSTHVRSFTSLYYLSATSHLSAFHVYLLPFSPTSMGLIWQYEAETKFCF